MATLSADVQARFPAQLLIDLTNPGKTGQSSIDTGRLGEVINDVEGDFQDTVGVSYDSTKKNHVKTAVRGVVARLRRYVGHIGVTDDFDNYMEALGRLALVTGRNRVMPKSTSELTPSSEKVSSNDEIRPDFDREFMGNVVPDERRATKGNFETNLP